jgi:hypothetical protein
MWINKIGAAVRGHSSLCVYSIIYSTCVCVCVYTGDLYSTGFKVQKFEELMCTQSFIRVLNHLLLLRVYG